MKGNTVTVDYQALKNRLLKNQKKLKSYLSKGKLEAYRLYHKDIPQWPYLIDIYGQYAVIYEQGKKLRDENQSLRTQHQEDVKLALSELGIPPERQFFKVREVQKGKEQYQALKSNSKDYFVVSEPPLKFWVNLERYLDTGLFLDHRPLRQHLFQCSQNKKILNLFCYTGSLSVAAAKGGGKLTSVDMSATYLDWAIENFKLNEIEPKEHVFYQADVLQDLKQRKDKNEKFDLIILDPPSFSNSKRMEGDLDVERDHPLLIRDCMDLLKKEGELFFSTNKRKFQLHPVVDLQYKVKEISQWTVPPDFHQTGIHRAFLIKHKASPIKSEA